MTATAAQTPTTRQATRPDPCATHQHPAYEQRSLAREVFDLEDDWQHPAPGKGAVQTMRRLRGCADGETRRAMADEWKAAIADLKLQHRYRLVATEPGFSGEGRFMRWLSVPKYIVECETEGYGNVPYSKGPRMTAYNTSGAQGAAQLLGWDNPWPVVTALDHVEYWEEAAYVLAVSGTSAWECA